MRILIAAGALLALLTTPAAAFFGHSYNEKWCLGYNYVLGDFLDCSYYTRRQCEATRSGLGGACIRNPSWTMTQRSWNPRQRGHRRWH